MHIFTCTTAVSIELEETSYIVDEGENVTVRVLKSGQSLIATRVGIILRPGSAFGESQYMRSHMFQTGIWNALSQCSLTLF